MRIEPTRHPENHQPIEKKKQEIVPLLRDSIGKPTNKLSLKKVLQHEMGLSFVSRDVAEIGIQAVMKAIQGVPIPKENEE
jgi:hypothetical protein